MNAAIIKNLEVLLAAVESQPDQLFELNTFKIERECGTCYCVAGLACSMPYFQELGMHWEFDPAYKGVSVWQGGGDELFGADSMKELFHYNGGGSLDYYLAVKYGIGDYENGDNPTDKALAIARLKYRIATLKGEK